MGDVVLLLTCYYKLRTFINGENRQLPSCFLLLCFAHQFASILWLVGVLLLHYAALTGDPFHFTHFHVAPLPGHQYIIVPDGTSSYTQHSTYLYSKNVEDLQGY